jgi:hypothetical protein
MDHTDRIDERAIELIAARVVGALKEDLAEIATGLGTKHGDESPLTVNDVAKRLCVSRSTVYAHWREWGGYKLGDSAKAPIRFGRTELEIGRAADQSTESPPLKDKPPRRRRRRQLILDAPRFDEPVEDLG